MADRADSERHMNTARRWFTAGWAGKYRAGRRPIQRERQDQWGSGRRGRDLSAGYKSGWRGFGDLTTTTEDMLSASDKIVTRLVGRGTHTGLIWGRRGHRRAGGGPRLCRLAFRRRQGGGNLDDTGSVRASKADRIFPRRGLGGVACTRRPRATERGTWSAPCGGGSQARY